jgi:hypothetical protein
MSLVRFGDAVRLLDERVGVVIAKAHWNAVRESWWWDAFEYEPHKGPWIVQIRESFIGRAADDLTVLHRSEAR